MKKRLLLVCILCLGFASTFAQNGKYKPTKYDTVKKVMPPQVYGRAKDKKKADTKKKPAMKDILAKKSGSGKNKKKKKNKYHFSNNFGNNLYKFYVF